MHMKTFSVEGALPRSYARLVALLPPMAIQDDIHHGNTVAMIDRLMQVSHLSAGQAAYLETLVELVESYEAKRQALDLARISPRQMLRHVLQEAGLSGSDLARLLGIHPSMGSKLAKGDRRVAWEHALTLGRHFHVSPALFMDA